MMATTDFTAVELDVLREIANIGSGHAATVLSQMIGLPIMIDVPQLTIEPLADVTQRVAPSEEPVVGLFMRIVGDLTGDTCFVLNEANATALCDLLLGRPAGTGGLDGPMEESSLKEAGNVMVSGFLNALSAFLSKCLLPSVPQLVRATAGTLTSDQVSAPDEPVLAATTSFRFGEKGDEREMQGIFLFALDPAAQQALLNSLHASG